MSRLLIAAGFVWAVMAAIVAWWVYDNTYKANLDRLARAGTIRVEQASDRLLGQIASYRVLTNMLARHPHVTAAVRNPMSTGAAGDLLLDAALKYGAENIAVTDTRGLVLAASPSDTPVRSESALLTAALNGRLGMSLGVERGKRLLHLSRGVIDGQPPARGVVHVTVDVGEMEFEWGVDPEAIGFFDSAGVVIAANRQSLLLTQDRSAGHADSRLRPFAAHLRATVGAHDLWTFDSADDLPARALVVSRHVPLIGMTARGFIDVAPARSDALLQALLAASLVLLIGLAALIATMWRRRFSDRLAFEAAANAQLEARVEERTAELRATQQQLVQASKMSALGQMSAGISHELNQPLAAIMNFAENGRKLLDRDRSADARGNFDVISQQVQRITRIIRNLRAFARSEEEPVGAVDFAAATNAARSLMEAALSKSRADLNWDVPDHPVMVRGGTVRLEQVVVNLLTNALDATADVDGARIYVSLETDTRAATLTVRDTGPGLADPARVFEPFYSTKELGASKGLGLGLSISYGIVGSFGGTIRCHNHPGGGAVFVVTLPRAPEGGHE